MKAFVEAVRDAASRTTDANRFGRKAYIVAVYGAMRTTMPMPWGGFVSNLIEAHQEGMLRLSRADLVQVMNRKLVEASEVCHETERWHFVDLDGFPAAPGGLPSTEHRSPDDPICNESPTEQGEQTDRLVLTLRRLTGTLARIVDQLEGQADKDLVWDLGGIRDRLVRAPGIVLVGERLGTVLRSELVELSVGLVQLGVELLALGIGDIAGRVGGLNTVVNQSIERMLTATRNRAMLG